MENEKKVKRQSPHILRFIPHLVIAVIALAVIMIMITLLKKWEDSADTVDIIRLNEEIIDPSKLIEAEDYYTYMDSGLLEQALSDGKLKTLILGDEAVSEYALGSSIASLMEKKMNDEGILLEAKSFSFPRLHYSPFYSQVNPDLPDNLISMYEIIKALCTGDFTQQKNVLQNTDFLLDYNNENQEVYARLIDKLSAVNMEEVDVIVISAGIWDYQTSVAIADLADLAAVYTHSGAVNASAKLIMEKWPRIRLIVMSPTYFRTDINGKQEGADTASNGIGRIGDYMTADKYVAVDSNFSFLDNLFGTGINEGNYREYLEKDLLFPNEQGRKIIADRISGILIKDFGENKQLTISG